MGGQLRVLVACEFSGVVRDAFRKLGHIAVSCDFLPTEKSSPYQEPSVISHYQGDVLDLLHEGVVLNVLQSYIGVGKWDLLIAHPPCTHLAVSGARWFKYKRGEQEEALSFVQKLMDADVPYICVENPVSIISSRIRKPDQVVQPWMFGHGETKATCLWLKNLPRLEPTCVVSGRVDRVHRLPPGPDRWKDRSRTYFGLAAAMAEQWGSFIVNTSKREVSVWVFGGALSRVSVVAGLVVLVLVWFDVASILVFRSAAHSLTDWATALMVSFPFGILAGGVFAVGFEAFVVSYFGSKRKEVSV